MSKKYIKQVDSQNFVYPNYELSEYDIEIVHDINNNSVSGSVTNLSATTVSSSAITFNYDYTWLKNNAETFVNSSGKLVLLSAHVMTPSQDFFKPFRMVQFIETSSTGITSTTGNTSFTITPTELQDTSFVNGDYIVEFRFVGHRAIFPITFTKTITGIIPPTPTPTPTPTLTRTPSTPTPTPTVTPTQINYQSGATLNVTDPGYIKYTTTGGTQYEFVSTTGTHTITACVLCDTILPGFPFADVAVFTVTNCGTLCSGLPSPTPTPTPTISTFNYYVMDIYSCFPCTDIGVVIGRTTATLSLNTWYTNGDGNAYYITNTNPGTTYDVDMTGAVSGPSCTYVCSI